MKQTNIEARRAEINNRITELPKGNISYVMFKPRDNQYDGIIIEFKVRDEKRKNRLKKLRGRHYLKLMRRIMHKS